MLLDQLNSYQISEWEAFNMLSPIGDERADLHMAILATTLFNLFVDIYAKKGTKHRELIDYMPNWSGEEVEKKQSVEEMKNFLLEFAKGHNEKLRKRKEKVKAVVVPQKEKPKKDG